MYDEKEQASSVRRRVRPSIRLQLHLILERPSDEHHPSRDNRQRSHDLSNRKPGLLLRRVGKRARALRLSRERHVGVRQLESDDPLARRRRGGGSIGETRRRGHGREGERDGGDGRDRDAVGSLRRCARCGGGGGGPGGGRGRRGRREADSVARGRAVVGQVCVEVRASVRSARFRKGTLARSAPE